MARYPEALLDQILARVDIIDLINNDVPLVKKGKNYSACCPFHDEKTASFTVSTEKQFYNCFGCGASGNAFTFIEQYHNKAFPEAVQELAALAGVPLPDERTLSDAEKKAQALTAKVYDKLAEADAVFTQNLATTPAVTDYLTARGITQDTISAFSIGAAKDEWQATITALGGFEERAVLKESGIAVVQAKTDTQKGKFYDRFRNGPVFTIRDERGRVVSFATRRLIDDTADNTNKHIPKYINGEETIVFKKTAVAYGLYEALQADPHPHNLIVTEGYMDVVMSHQYEHRNTVATMGTATSTQLLKKLYRYTSELVFCFDGDHAGRTASSRALHALLPLMEEGRTAKFLFLPDGEDIDSFLRTFGADAYKLYMDTQAVPVSQYLLKEAQGSMDSLTSIESRAQYFTNAKTMLDMMPPSNMKSLMLGKVEEITGMRPSEYMPYSVQLREGHLNGVDLGTLEGEIREFIAAKIGAPAADVKVAWSMPEIEAHRQVKYLVEATPTDIHQTLGHRMREVSRILGLDTRVSNGVTLAQLLNTANNATDYSKDLAQGLLTRYLRDTNSLEVECKLVLHHLSVIQEGLERLDAESGIASDVRNQALSWLGNIGKRSGAILALTDQMDPGLAHRITVHVESMSVTAEKAMKAIAIDTVNEEARPSMLVIQRAH